jgi:hypothetical protein
MVEPELGIAKAIKAGTVQLVDEINAYARNFFVGGSGLANHALEMVRHDFLLSRIDTFIDGTRGRVG